MRYLDNEAVQFINGGVAETTAVLAERFDKIVYTGSTRVGRIVMQAAAKHLTPVLLELGGKSPCYVDEHVNIRVAARRIVWGRYVNAGQTCVAPDYILCHEKVHDQLIEALGVAIKAFFGTARAHACAHAPACLTARATGEHPKNSDALARIVSKPATKRLHDIIHGGGKIVIGGETDIENRYVAPTVLVDVKPKDKCMEEEVRVRGAFTSHALSPANRLADLRSGAARAARQVQGGRCGLCEPGARFHAHTHAREREREREVRLR